AWLFFFFSSRRRHTRSYGDWSSDVCSSDLMSYRMGSERIVLVSAPHLIKDILVTHSRNFHKGRGLERSKRLLGEGLLTSEGAVRSEERRVGKEGRTGWRAEQ